MVVPDYLTDTEAEQIQFPEKDIPPRTDFGIRIDGNSMEPEIPNGAIVFVRACPAIENGQVGIFALNGCAYCKRLEVNHERQRVRLLSNNPDYKPIEVKSDDYLHTFGQVIGYPIRKG